MINGPETISRPLSRSPSGDPWYTDSPKFSRPLSPRSPRSPNSFVAVHDETSKPVNSLVSKRLLNSIGRIEDATSSLIDYAIVSDISEIRGESDDMSAAFAELNAVICDLETTIKNLRDAPDDRECFSCVSLQCENDSMKDRISVLEKELTFCRERIDDSSTAAGKVTPQPVPIPEKTVGPSTLVSASMRLKSVTAALNKALHPRKVN